MRPVLSYGAAVGLTGTTEEGGEAFRNNITLKFEVDQGCNTRDRERSDEIGKHLGVENRIETEANQDALA